MSKYHPIINNIQNGKHMKRIILIAVTLLAVATPIAPASAESGDQRPCVTKGEWNKVRDEMSRKSVHQLFDTRGTHDYGYAYNSYREEHRRYRACPSFGGDTVTLKVMFDNDGPRSGMRVWGKARSFSW